MAGDAGALALGGGGMSNYWFIDILMVLAIGMAMAYFGDKIRRKW